MPGPEISSLSMGVCALVVLVLKARTGGNVDVVDVDVDRTADK